MLTPYLRHGHIDKFLRARLHMTLTALAAVATVDGLAEDLFKRDK